MEFVYPSSINTIKAKLTPIIYQNIFGIETILAYIGGIYYNDNTPGGNYIGDIMAYVGVGG